MSEEGPSNPATVERSLNRQAVLEEDEYTNALSHIIARDFFPSLVQLDAANGYLDALRSEDPTLINASVARLQELATPATRRVSSHQLSQTPWGNVPTDTPLRTPHSEGGRPSKRPRYDSDMSLDDFQARYTSEDNSSFTQILHEENRLRKEKWGWAWEAQKRVEAQRDRMIESRERMLIEPASAPGVREKFTIEAPKPMGLITEGSAENVESQELVRVETPSEDVEDAAVDVMAPKKDTRRAGVDGWKFKARNSLMFAPDADMAPYDPFTPSKTDESKTGPKTIKHNNTRLPEQDESMQEPSASEPPSPSRSRIAAAISGTPYRPSSPSNDPYSLLPTMPSPTPAQLGPAAVKKLMTWGTLNATPRILSKSDDPADDLPPPSTPFHIPNATSREVLSHKLSSDAAKSLRTKAALMGGSIFSSNTTRTPGRSSMPPPSWTPRKADRGNLTPAAKRLLDRTTVAGSKRAEAMSKSAGWESGSKAIERDLNRVRWTPSPSPVSRSR